MPCEFNIDIFGDRRGCQFNVAEEELYSFSGKRWCEFHLPMGDGACDENEKSIWEEEEIERFNKKIFTIINSEKKDEENKSVVDLFGVVFPGSIDFSNKILPSITFNYSELNGYAKFIGARFTGEVKFEHTSFNSRVDFNKVIFKKSVLFNNSKFNGDSIFNDAVYSSDACYKDAEFLSYATFTNAVFEGKTLFDHAVFNDFVIFSQAKFNCITSFIDTKFNKDTSFSYSNFKLDVIFNVAKFMSNTQFVNSSFRGNISFVATLFENEALFNSATFYGFASFKDAIFKGDALFDASPDRNKKKSVTGGVFHNISFENVSFFKLASFMNRWFLATTSFKRCEFTKAPNFHNSKIHQDTDFTGAIFFDKLSEYSPRAYRTLKLAMEESRARDEHARFYAYEQESIRNQFDTPMWVVMSSWLYEKLSNYGQCALRPLICMAVIFLMSWVVYFGIAGFDPSKL